MDQVPFGMDDPRVIADAELKRQRVRAWLAREGLDGVVISRREHFAWLTSGGDSHVLKNSEIGVGHLVVTRDRQYLLAHSMDAARLAEEQVSGQDYELVILHWFDGDPRLAARKLAGERLAADTPLPGAVDASQALAYLHDPLTPLELDRCRWLGNAISEILENAAQEAKPGQTELEIARFLSGACVERGIDLDVLIVGSDERLRKYRHPLPTDKPVERYVLLHPAARRWGLHANVSRSLYFGDPPAEIQRVYRAAAAIEARVLAALHPGASFAEIFAHQKEWYAELGFPGEWQNHFQGGPTGYVVVDALRNQTDMRVQAGQAFDWFITITGAKVEEFSLLTAGGIELASRGSRWPLIAIPTRAGTVQVPDLWVRL